MNTHSCRDAVFKDWRLLCELVSEGDPDACDDFHRQTGPLLVVIVRRWLRESPQDRTHGMPLVAAAVAFSRGEGECQANATYVASNLCESLIEQLQFCYRRGIARTATFRDTVQCRGA